MIRGQLAVMLHAEHVKRNRVSYDLHDVGGRYYMQLNMDKNFQRLMNVDGHEGTNMTILKVIKDLRNAAFIEAVEGKLEIKVRQRSRGGAVSVRWSNPKVYCAALQLQSTPATIQLPCLEGVPGIEMTVLLDMPNKPLMIEYKDDYLTYMVEVCTKQRQSSSEKVVHQRPSIGIAGVCTTKYFGSTALKCRRDDGKSKYCKYNDNDDDEYATAVKKARFFMDGNDSDNNSDVGEVDDDDTRTTDQIEQNGSSTGSSEGSPPHA